MAGQDASVVDRSSVRFVGPVFPKTRCSLWDKTSVGQPVLLHISHYRKPRLCIPEKILKLMQHQCENYGQDRYMLIGTLVVDDDGEGIQILVDRLDTRPKCPTASVEVAAGNIAINFQVANNAAIERAASVDDYILAFKHLQSRCYSKDSVDLCSFFQLYGWGSFYSNAQTSVLHLDWDMVTMETTFKSTPVTPVPIVLTALSKNLTSPRSLSNLQGAPKTGYLTMDHTRKLLLVLESDPKAAVLPVVGIWVSGVEVVHHPFVWAACLRYTYNVHLQDRVCSHPEPFLLVLYTLLHTRPEFYQCETGVDGTCLQFELSSGHEVINMDKGLTSPDSGSFVEVEMESTQAGIKMDNFEAAKVKLGLMAEVGFPSRQEDLEPRCAPTPHSEKVPVFHPMVPDVSVLWTESYENQIMSDRSNNSQDAEFFPQDPQKQSPHMDVSKRLGLSALKDTHPILTDSVGHSPHAQHTPQPHVFSTRPPLSHHYSPSGQYGQQFLPTISRFPRQHYPTDVPSEGFYNYSVPGQINVHPVHARALPTQSPTVTPLPPVGSSNKVNLAYTTAGSSSHSNYQPPRTSMVTHTVNQRLPLSATVDSSYETLDGNWNNPHVGYPQNTRSRLTQNPDNSQLATSSFQQGQATLSTVPVENGTRHPAAVGQTQTNIVQSTSATQHFQQILTRDFFQPRATLNTITEETTATTFSPSQKLDHHLGSESQGIDLEGRVSNKSPPGHSNSNNSRRTHEEDSGFSDTPERHPISVVESENASLPSAGSRLSAAAIGPSPSLPLQSSIDKIQWEQIPTQIRDLLIQQHVQLQQLQQQVQMLQAQQLPQSNPVSPLSEVSNSERSQNSRPKRYASVAVNTSFCGDQGSSQPSQGTPGVSDSVRTPLRAAHHRQLVPAVDTSPVDVLRVTNEAGHSPQKSSRRSQLEVSQKDLDDAIMDAHAFDQSTNMDMSEYVSYVDDRSQMDDQSTSSDGDYYRQSQENLHLSLGEDAADRQRHYSQLMKNVQAFLNNGGSPDSKPCPLAIAGPDTGQQMVLSKLECSAIVPEISSVSMLLGCGSDSGQSIEINALAMKYLSDEQLTRMAKLRQSAPNTHHKSAYSAKILQQVIGTCQSSHSETTSTPNVSRLGISPSDMTLGTMMYLEKHGLLGNDASAFEHPVMGEELQLRTDFSILTNVANLSLTTNGEDPYIFTDTNQSGKQFIQLSPGSHQPRINFEMTKSPAIPQVAGQTAALANNENWLPQEMVIKDFAASPTISTKNRLLAGQVQLTTANIRQRNVLQEMKPHDVINARTGSSNSPSVSPRVEGQEWNLLDITMLKQMPKLL